MRPILLLVMMMACGGTSSKDVIEKNKAAIESQLARFAAVGADVAKRPPVETDAIQAPSKPLNLVLSELNAAVVYPGYLNEPCDGEELHWLQEGRAKNHETRILSGPGEMREIRLASVACMTRKGTGEYGGEPPAADDLSSALAYFTKVEAVIVPRFTFQRPTYNIDGDGKVRTFNPGRIYGDVLVYELANAKYLGGFKLDVTNAAEVKNSSHSTFHSLQHDLVKHATDAMWKRLDELAPGTKHP